MTPAKRFLVAIDESEASMRALDYLGHLLGGRADVGVSLLHVLGPLPPELLETGGAATAEEEARIEAEQEVEQEAWLAKARARTAPLFAAARARLEQAGIPRTAIHDHAFARIPEDRIHERILEAAAHCGCDTVVMGRRERGWVAELLGRHVSHGVLRHARRVTVWVVE